MDVNTDQLSLLIDYARAVIREAYENRFKVVLCFALVSITVLLMGLFAPKRFESSATLMAERQNIIQPLLSGQASVTRVEDQTRVVREVIYASRLLRQVVESTHLLDPNASASAIERKTDALRSSVKVKGIGGSYIKVSYASGNADTTYRVLNAIVELFIKNSAASKRKESRDAYDFINDQVDSYKLQLQDAEKRLKKFKSTSLDGTEASVKGRIAQLRTMVETIQLDVDDIRTRISGLQAELGKENSHLSRSYKSSVYRDRLINAQQQLENLLLTYTETYPDVVALKYQIRDMETAIKQTQSEVRNDGQNQDSGQSLNPLYEELRGKLAEANVELQTRLRRHDSTKNLLTEEYARLKRIAENQAELAELTRDYTVNRGLYEDMLERKERARLSMTLDIEGRGLSYRVREPAVYPQNATGLRLIHFALIGPLLGILVPLGLLVALVVVDPRIRFESQIAVHRDIEILGVVPHMPSSIGVRLLRWDAIVIFFVLFSIGSVYGVLGYLKLTGGI